MTKNKKLYYYGFSILSLIVGYSIGNVLVPNHDGDGFTSISFGIILIPFIISSIIFLTIAIIQIDADDKREVKTRPVFTKPVSPLTLTVLGAVILLGSYFFPMSVITPTASFHGHIDEIKILAFLIGSFLGSVGIFAFVRRAVLGRIHVLNMQINSLVLLIVGMGMGVLLFFGILELSLAGILLVLALAGVLIAGLVEIFHRR